MNGWHELPGIVLNLAVAFVLGIPVGWDRERQDFGPGLRTYPLLAMGACAYVEIGQFAFHDHIEGQARVFQALVSGIGFIGAGAIIKGRAEVHGLATAVSLWVTVSVGIAASYRLFALGAVLSATTLGALRLLKPLKRHPEKADQGIDRTNKDRPQ
jgi:putative Mg2+ transporter-C (MgtC) family protein